jgi:N-acetylneuraminic acid mutarotase
MFNTDNISWTPLPELPESRSRTHAGVAALPDGRKVFVVAGGANDRGQTLKSSEILELDKEGTWREGPPLPRSIQEGSSVQFNDTFLVVGGRNWRNVDSAAIFKFVAEEEGERWEEMPQALQVGRSLHTAFLVPESFFGDRC